MTELMKVKSRMGFLGWLTLLFIALKLTGFVSWSWGWVLAPIWIPVVLAVVVAVLFALTVGIRKPN